MTYVDTYEDQMTVAPLVQSFEPDVNSSKLFRSALGQFGTGVTVVTADGLDGPVGMTANSFASVSLDPPLVLWSPAKSAHRFPYFESAEHFAIHVLSAEQKWMANHFTKSSNGFEGVDWTRNAHNVPVIAGALARFECVRHATVDGGDHLIVIGRVQHVTMRAGDPLMFCDGQFGKFDSSL